MSQETGQGPKGPSPPTHTHTPLHSLLAQPFVLEILKGPPPQALDSHLLGLPRHT